MKTLALLGLTVGILLGVDFNPEKHLPGYTEAYWGADAGFYDFTPFEEKNGKKVTDQELLLLRAQWEREKQAAAERKKAPPDPRKQFLGAVDETLRKDRFFARQKFERVEGENDVLLLVQLPAKPPNLYVDGIKREYGGHVRAVQYHFCKRYVEPLGLERGPRVPLTVLVVLASRGNYDDYGEARPHGFGLQVSLAHYNPRHKFSITFEDGTAINRRNSDEKMRTVCHEVVHALTDAYSATGIDTMPLWLVEGLAEYVSTFRGFVRSGSIEFAHLSRDDLRTCAAILHHEETREVFPGIQDLFRVRNIFMLVPIAADRMGRSLSELQQAAAMGVLYPASNMLAYYLHQGAPDETRRRFQEFLRGAFRGKSSYDDFLLALGIQDAAAFDREFQEYVLKLAGDEFGIAVPELPAIRTDVRPPAATRLAPAALVLPPATAEETTGRALSLAGAGRFADALALARQAPSAADVVSFLAALKDYSDGVLLAAKTKNVNVIFGPGLARRVVFFDDAVVLISDWKQNESRIDRALFGPNRTVEYARKFSLSNALLDATIALLWGEEEDAASARLDAAAGDALQARRAAWPALLLAAQVRERLERLRDALPADNQDPDPVLADLEFVLRAGETCQSASSLRDTLLAVARSLLEKKFERDDLACASFTVRPVASADGCLEFRYGFREPNEMLDFDVEWNPPDPLQGFLGIPTLPRDWQVSSDGLRATGSLNLVHKACFLAPVTVEVTSSLSMASSTFYHSHLLALCLDIHGSFAALIGGETLAFCNAAGRCAGQQPAAVAVDTVIDAMRVVTLRYDGALLSADLDGRRIVDLPLKDMPAGRVALAQRGSTRWNIRSLVLRGKLAPDFAAQAMESWVKERLREMGG
ncbi:MAG: hypothetical protein HY812_16495 [Planctomycetes bacterium]|nr:hypothetical protein [Planctomycetota bacterium]